MVRPYGATDNQSVVNHNPSSKDVGWVYVGVGWVYVGVGWVYVDIARLSRHRGRFRSIGVGCVGCVG
jgi:hypothetical protein